MMDFLTLQILTFMANIILIIRQNF